MTKILHRRTNKKRHHLLKCSQNYSILAFENIHVYSRSHYYIYILIFDRTRNKLNPKEPAKKSQEHGPRQQAKVSASLGLRASRKSLE